MTRDVDATAGPLRAPGLAAWLAARRSRAASRGDVTIALVASDARIRTLNRTVPRKD